MIYLTRVSYNKERERDLIYGRRISLHTFHRHTHTHTHTHTHKKKKPKKKHFQFQIC